MEKIQNVLMKYLMPIANKLEQQKHIQAIKDGIVASIPIIIVGSFCTIFLGIANLIGSGPVYDFLSANMGVLTYASAFTNDMLAVYATYFIAKNLSEKYDLKGSQPAVTALVVFFILCAVVKDGQLNTSYLGATGLFTGIVAALFTVEIYHICYEHKWYIKMPESVPPMVQDMFAALGTISIEHNYCRCDRKSFIDFWWCCLPTIDYECISTSYNRYGHTTSFIDCDVLYAIIMVLWITWTKYYICCMGIFCDCVCR